MGREIIAIIGATANAVQPPNRLTVTLLTPDQGWRRGGSEIGFGKQEQPMNPMWFNLLESWGPFLVLILMWIGFTWFLRRRSRTASGHTIPELYEQQLEEMKRHTTTLERIAKALENRGRE